MLLLQCFKWKQQFVKVSQIHYVPVLQVNGYHAEKIMNLPYLDMFKKRKLKMIRIWIWVVVYKTVFRLNTEFLRLNAA